MIDLIGYAALGLNLLSMTMKDILYLRLFSFLANVSYIIYGVMLSAMPIIVGCSIAVAIHSYHIVKIKIET
ncbi:MAG: hypothetical protein AAGI07_18045 [Bacteroidota bacterium]